METRKYKNQNISLLGLGCMRLPRIGETTKIDFTRAAEMLDYSFSHGINYVDTAYMYHEGDSEQFLGQALKRYPRDSYFLADKMPIWYARDRAEMERIFDNQLKKLNTGYFDFYLFHSLNTANFDKCIELDLYGFLTKKKEAGIIRNLGFSFHDTPEVLERICSHPGYSWDFAQIQLNYYDWELQRANEQYEILQRHGIPVIVMEPVRGGALADLGEAANSLLQAARPANSIASWALRYAANLPGVFCVLSGMSNMEQLKDNISTFKPFEPLNDDEKKLIAEVNEIYKNKDVIGCTACRYCMDCPSGVDIPEMFRLFNEFAVSKNKNALTRALKKSDPSTRASKCTNCGACTPKCPQAIKIPEKMLVVAGYEG